MYMDWKAIMKEHNDLLEQTMPKKEAPVVETPVEAVEAPKVPVEVPVAAPVSRRKRR
jgi:hypothetical protein